MMKLNWAKRAMKSRIINGFDKVMKNAVTMLWISVPFSLCPLLWAFFKGLLKKLMRPKTSNIKPPASCR